MELMRMRSVTEANLAGGALPSPAAVCAFPFIVLLRKALSMVVVTACCWWSPGAAYAAVGEEDPTMTIMSSDLYFERVDDLGIHLHNQGLVTDGTYLYEIVSHRIVKWRLADWTEVARNEDRATMWGGHHISSMGGGCFHEGYLYVAGGTYVADGKANIFKIDPKTLAAVEVWDIQEHTSYGINTVNYWDGYWYVGETSARARPRASIYVFDDSFQFIKRAFQSDERMQGFQDGTLYGQYLILSDHEGGYWGFAKNPDLTLRHAHTIQTPATDSQGIAFDPQTGLFYLGDRRDSRIARLVGKRGEIK